MPIAIIQPVEFLLEELGADCNIRNKQGETALMIALQKRQINIAKYILSLPEVNINFEDVTGFTAFIYAANQTGFMRLFNFTAAQKVIAADPHKKESLYNPYTEKESLKIAHKLFVDSLAPDLKFKVTISIPGREEEMPIGCILLRVCLEYDNKEFAQTLVAAGVDTEPLSVDNTCLEYIMTNKEIPLYKHHNFDKKWEYRHNSWEATRQRIIDRTKLKLEQAKTTPEAGSVEQPIVDNEVTRNR